MPGLFPPGSAIHRILGHPVVLLGGGRALLMQLAHPAVAQGVIDHSGFESDPFGRLQRTLDAVNTILFGSEEDARRVVAGVGAVHARVRGPGYSATDPDLVLWVHATLVDTALRMHARFVGPVEPGLARDCYAQAAVVGELFGAPIDMQPPDLTAFRTYVRAMVADLAGRVGDNQRRLARAVLHPDVPFVVDPAVAVARQMTVGILPSPLRLAFGLEWDRPREAALQATGFGARLVGRPLRLAGPPLRLARRLVPVP